MRKRASRPWWKLSWLVLAVTLGLAGPAGVRDCWRIRELGKHADRFSATVPPRFVAVYRIEP